MTNKTKRSPRVPRAALEEDDADLQPNPNRPIEPDSDEGSDSNSSPPNPNHHSHSNSNERTLHLTSFSHKRGPLHPKPSILIDLRTLQNPPKELRATQTGLTKSLRGWLVQNTEFKKRFDEAVAKIEEAMKGRVEVRKEREREEVRKGKREEEDDREIEDDDDEEMEIRVGVRCEMGRHRSVAFVEELSRYRWPKPWNVVVDHRDVDVERTRESLKGAGRRRGKKWEDDGE